MLGLNNFTPVNNLAESPGKVRTQKNIPSLGKTEFNVN